MTGIALSSYNVWVPYDTTQPKTATADGQGVWSASICTCGVRHHSSLDAFVVIENTDKRQNCCDWANAEAPELRCFEVSDVSVIFQETLLTDLCIRTVLPASPFRAHA